MGVVIEEVLLDHFALVAKRDIELTQIMMSEVLHDVPEDRPPADVEHRLRQTSRFLLESRAESSRKDNCLHERNRSGNQ